MMKQRWAAMIALRIGSGLMGEETVDFVQVNMRADGIGIVLRSSGCQTSLNLSLALLNDFPDLQIGILTAIKESVKMLAIEAREKRRRRFMEEDAGVIITKNPKRKKTKGFTSLVTVEMMKELKKEAR